MLVEPTENQASLSEVETILYQVRVELYALATAGVTGNITIHCASDGYQVEVNSRLKKISKGPVRKGWEQTHP